jgi:hypothetical protein
MSEPEFGVVLFPSTNWALRAEGVLKSAGLEVKLIPTPRHLSSDCGTALRFVWADKEPLIAVLTERKVTHELVAPLLRATQRKRHNR